MRFWLNVPFFENFVALKKLNMEFIQSVDTTDLSVTADTDISF